MPLKKVSVILPAYNAEDYLYSAIASILVQSYNFFELIIINDGSTDSTDQIVRSFKDERIRYFNQSHNSGLIHSLNFGIEKAQGDFIARMDADDIAHPDRLLIQVNFLNHLGKPAIVGSNMVLINSKNKVIKVPRRMNFSSEENSWVKIRKCPIHHPTVMMSKEVAHSRKPFYASEDKYAEDYGAWLRVEGQFPIYNLKSYLLFYRIHETNLSAIHHVDQLKRSVELINCCILKMGLKPFSPQILQQMLLLKTTTPASYETIVNELGSFGSSYIAKYGKENIVRQDMAYALLSIGFKSCITVMSKSLSPLFKFLGFKNILIALARIGQEFINSVVLKIHFQLEFNNTLKRQRSTQTAIKAKLTPYSITQS